MFPPLMELSPIPTRKPASRVSGWHGQHTPAAAVFQRLSSPATLPNLIARGGCTVVTGGAQQGLPPPALRARREGKLTHFRDRLEAAPCIT